MTNSEIADVFEKIAEILEIKGENVFKIRAYSNASRVINQLGDSLEELKNKDKLDDIPGIGKDLSLKIKELLKTGHLSYYDELVKSVPGGLLELMKIRGLGPKKANIIYKNFSINSIDELYDALLQKRFTDVNGFGEKTINNLKESIEEYRTFNQRFLYPAAIIEAKSLEAYLLDTKNKIISRIMIAGSLRRKMETVGDIDFVVSIKEADKNAFSERLANYSNILRIESAGETKISVILKSGIHVDFRLVPEEDFVYALHHFTGSKLHNEELRAMVKKEGYKINEYGIFKLKESNKDIEAGGKKIKVKDENEFYAVFNMQYIPPELREGTGEIYASIKHSIPRLVAQDDLQGIFHVHTTYTDGKDSLEEMVEGAVKAGYKYIGISDHSVSAHYAGGLNKSDLRSQIEYIDRLNQRYAGKIKIFKGIESDILQDGNLDYDEETLSNLDFVIASVHSGFNMSEEKMTKRIINAVKNPYTTMIGHLTGRLLLERKGYDVDVSKIIDACAKYKTIIELNANPKRLDIDWRHIKEAVSKSVMLSINPDAHSVSHFYFIEFGINSARKGWATKKEILNAKPAAEAANFLHGIREYKLRLQGKTETND